MDILMLKANPIATAEVSPKPASLGRPDVKTTAATQGNAPPGKTKAVGAPDKEATRTGPKTPENLLDLVTGLTNTSSTDPVSAQLRALLGRPEVKQALQDIKTPPSLDDLVKALSLLGVTPPASTQASLSVNDSQATLFKSVANSTNLPEAVKQVVSGLLAQAVSTPLPASTLIDMTRATAPPAMPAEVGPRPTPVPKPVTQSAGPILGMPDPAIDVNPVTVTITGAGQATGMSFDPNVVQALNLTAVHLGMPDQIVPPPGQPVGSAPPTDDQTGYILGIPNGDGSTTGVVGAGIGTGNTGTNGIHGQTGPLPYEDNATNGSTSVPPTVTGANSDPATVPPSNGATAPPIAKTPPADGRPIHGGVGPLPVQDGLSLSNGSGIRGQIDPLPGQTQNGSTTGLIDPDGTGNTDNAKDHSGDNKMPAEGPKGFRPTVKAWQEANGKQPDLSNTAPPKGFQPTVQKRLDNNGGLNNGSDATKIDSDSNISVGVNPDTTSTTDGATSEPLSGPTAPPIASAPPSNAASAAIGVQATSAKPVTATKVALAADTVNSVSKQIVDRMESMVLAKKNGAVTIKLNPIDMGSVTLTIKSFGSKIDADIKASNDEVRTALTVHRTDLLNTIESRGLTMNSFTVGQEANQQPGNGQNNQSNHAEAQRAAQLQSGLSTASNAVAVAPAATAYSATTTAMDLVV